MLESDIAKKACLSVLTNSLLKIIKID